MKSTSPRFHNLSRPAGEAKSLCLRGQRLTIAEVRNVALGKRVVSITNDPAVLKKLQKSQALVQEAVKDGQRIYGITTGFGSMADMPVSGDEAEASQENLLEFLACGSGKPIDKAHVRAAMVLRANMLLQGASGVRLEIVERLVAFLNADIAPVVGELGSIGASGDLVPLATIARAITGQASPCQVTVEDKEMDRDEALKFLGLKPLRLLPKEGLAIVNGTTFSAAIGLNCFHDSRNLLGLSFASHAMMTRALLGHEDPFAPFVHQCKPHPGQVWAARMMRQLLGIKDTCGGQTDDDEKGNHLQDRYSIRCLPQYMGPIVDGIIRVQEILETEMNAVTDNPLIECESGQFFQSGNFLGQYVGIAMDDLRKYIGLLAKHLDVQIALLVSPEFNHGLPASLTGTGVSPINMNLKGLQISGNSIMPLLMHLANPLVDHFPTHAEQYNQNVNGLSWGAANLASQSVELFSQYSSIALLFAVQAIDLRKGAMSEGSDYDGRTLLEPMVLPLYKAVYEAAGEAPGSETPLISNSSNQGLEKTLAVLTKSIRENGNIIRSVSPIVESLGEEAHRK